MRYLFVVFSLFLVIFSSTFCEEAKIKIGIIYDSQNLKNEKMKNIFINEITKLVGETNIEISKELYGGDETEKIKNEIEELENDNNVNVILTLGVISSYEANQNNDSKKMIITPFLFSERAVKNQNNKNIKSIIINFDIIGQLNDFIDNKELSKLIIVEDNNIFGLYPELLGELENKMKEKTVKYEIVNIENIKEKYNKVNKNDGIFFLNFRDLKDDNKNELNNFIKKSKTPVYFLIGEDLESDSSKKSLEKIARKTALMFSKIYDGIDVNRIENIDININKKMVIETEKNNDIQKKSLVDIIQRALDYNLNLNTVKKDVNIQEENVKSANSKFYPQITLGVNGVVIDKNSADSSMGSMREKSVTGNVGLTQILYSLDANINKEINKKIVVIKSDEVKLKEMDLITEIAVTYLTGLKAQSNLKIQNELLDANLENLKIAENKTLIGEINYADVYRWKSEVANSKSNVEKAIATIKQIKESLRKIAMIEDSSDFEFEDINNIYDYSNQFDEKIKKFIDEGKNLEIENLFIQNAFNNSVELKIQKKSQDIKNSYYEYAKKSIYTPTIFFQANYKNKIYEGGRGKEGIGDILKPVLGIDMKEINTDNTWNIGVGISLDIYTGGEKEYATSKSEIELEKSRIDGKNLKNEIEKSIKQEVVNIITEYQNIKNMHEAVEALEKNHKIVNDAYLKGMINMSELLSSRNALVYAEQGENIARYDYMMSIIRLERYSGKFEGANLIGKF